MYDEFIREKVMVNYEIKGTLARLLATENLIVENRRVGTASFNVHTRVLTLPMWERANGDVYDLLVSHEVGHALFTPDKDWDLKIPRDYLNITEDARIEKLMKRRFNGLYKTFLHGYEYLAETDFFELDGTDINKMSFADRVNLHFKIGKFVDIDFTDSEKEVVDMVEASETFDDAIAAAHAMYELAKAKVEQQQKLDQKTDAPEVPGSASGEGPQGQFEDQNDGESEETDDEESVQQSGGSGGSDDWDESVVTDELFSEKVEELNRDDNMHFGENQYVDYPNMKEGDLVVSNEYLRNTIKDFWSVCEEEAFTYVDTSLKKFMKDSAKEVNYLVKEFECRKAADAYSRSTVARTGVLDTSKLHTYKYNDDVFKKLNIIPEGKNHGLVFVLDWSGSMSNVLQDTVKQLINLIVFCRKVSIPFEVYAFTNNWVDTNDDGDLDVYVQHLTKFKQNELFLDPRFRMLNLVSSKAKNAEIDESIRNLFRLSYAIRHYVDFPYPPNLGLSGTPLCDAVVALHTIVPNFQKRNAIQKTNVIILTDGDTAPIRTTCESERFGIGAAHVGYNTYLRCRKTGETKQLGHWFKQLTILLDNFKKSHPNINLIGIRLVDRGEWARFSNIWITKDAEKVRAQWKKDRSATIKGTPFDAFFAMACQSLNNDVEFEVEEDATKAQIRKAFKKSLQSKALNKKILSDFIDLVA